MSKPKVEKGQIVLPKDSFKDAKIKVMLDKYRNSVSSRYQSLDPNDIAKYLTSGKYTVSRKYDGELWFLVIQDGKSVVVAPNGRMIVGGLSILDVDHPNNMFAVIAGELHSNNDKERERVGDISYNLAQGKLENLAKLQFSAFDLLVAPDLEWENCSYEKRLEALKNLTIKDLRLIESEIADEPNKIIEIYKRHVDESRAEGIIVRGADGRAYKVKPNLFIDAYVIAFTTRKSVDGELECRSLLLGLMTKESQIIPIGVSGSFAESVSRKDFLNLIHTSTAPSDYRLSASSGQLFTFCKPEVIVEVKALDFQATDSRNRPIKQPKLSYAIDSGYKVNNFLNAGSLSNAVITRIRDDKINDQLSVRWEQVEDFLPVLEIDLSELPKSEIIERRVWTKSSAEKTDVRKLVVWKTNKDQFDETYPPYVVHWTDYSSPRKSPISREVKPAYSRDFVKEIVESLVSENIKKGWSEHKSK
jgi:ATP-dependent DNA ligase